MRSALITGITGQDGIHLARLLLSKGYKVSGTHSGHNLVNLEEFKSSFPNVLLFNADLADFSSLLKVIDQNSPDELYNLGSISLVSYSFRRPEITANVAGLGTLRLLEAIRALGAEKSLRFYQASSSEIFGRVTTFPQNELTPFDPKSPYGVAKVFAHQTCKNYREEYNMHISCGILFNHEGENRGKEFVSRKITSHVAQIKLGLIDGFSLGNLNSRRDWGYAGDYVEAMWLMLQQQVPDDYVIATGVTHSVEDFLIRSFEVAGIERHYSNYVTLDKELERPAEPNLLVGDSSKALNTLGWKAKTTFSELVQLMVSNDISLLSE